MLLAWLRNCLQVRRTVSFTCGTLHHGLLCLQAGGWISRSGRVNSELDMSRCSSYCVLPTSFQLLFCFPTLHHDMFACGLVVRATQSLCLV